MPANDGSLARVLMQQGFNAAAAQAIDDAIADAGIGGTRDGTHLSGPLHAGIAAVMKGRLPPLCGF